MYIEPAQFFTIFFIYFFLIFSLIVLFVSYKKLQRRLTLFEKQELDESDELVREARDHAHEIISNAMNRAEKMLLEAEYLKKEFVKEGEKHMERVSEHIAQTISQEAVDYDKEYKRLFEWIQGEYAKKIDEQVKKIQQAAESEIADFKTILQKETVGSQAYIGEKINTQFEEARREIETYKESQIKKLDEAINTLVADVVKDVVGKTLTVADHEKIILEALTLAKKENVLFELSGTPILEKPVV